MTNVDVADELREGGLPRDDDITPVAEDHVRELRQRHQAARLRAHWKIEIDMGGEWRDVTDRLEPYLISVTVLDRIMGLDEAKIELDDRDGRLGIPGFDARVRVEFGWQNEAFYRVFTGFVQDVESGFSRKGGGRRLWIDCKAFLLDQGVFDLQQWHKGEGAPPGQNEGKPIPLADVWPEIAQMIGARGVIDADVGKISRDYWYLHNESVMHWLMRLVGETGVGFKLAPGVAALFNPRSSRNALGEPLTEILAEWGVNLLVWRIKPYNARPNSGRTLSRWFDVMAGEWKDVRGSVMGGGPFGGAKGVAGIPAGFPNARVGEQNNDSLAFMSEFNRGTGYVIINGEPQAKAGADIVVWGARPGVDGRYQMEEVEHTYTRAGGYTTRIRVKRPTNVVGSLVSPPE